MNHKESDHSLIGASRRISTNTGSVFEDVSYGQIDSEQRREFAQLLKKVTKIEYHF